MAIKDNETIFGFDIGNEVNLPINKTEGRFKITQDTHNMYLDIDEDTRISIGAGRYAPTWARKILSILAIEGPIKHNYSLEVDGDVINSNNDPLTRQAWEINDIVNLDGAGHISNAYKITKIDVSVTNATKTGYKSTIILEDIMPEAAKSVIGVVSPEEGETKEDIYNSENWAYVPGKINGELLTQYSDYQFKDSYVFGSTALASGWGSIAAGRDTRATGNYATAFGRETEAGYAGFAAGVGAKAGTAGIALGNNVQALGNSSFASGSNTRSYAAASRAGGKYTEAWMPHSTAEGYYTIAKAHCQFVIGEYNKVLEGPNDDSDPNKALFIVGNGTSSNRSNAFEVYRNGGAKFQHFNLTSDDGGVLIKNNNLYFIKNDNNQYEIWHTGNFDIDTQVKNVNNLTNYYTKNYIDTNYYTKDDIITNYYTKNNINTNYYTKNNIDTNYYTKNNIDTKVETINNTFNNYLSLLGGTLAGPLTLPANQYFISNKAYGIDLNNSDIINANGIWFRDIVDTANEGIHFSHNKDNNTATSWDSLYATQGNLYFKVNKSVNNANQESYDGVYTILHTGNAPAALGLGDYGLNYSFGTGNILASRSRYNFAFGLNNTISRNSSTDHLDLVMANAIFGSSNVIEQIKDTNSVANCFVAGGSNNITAGQSKVFGTHNISSHINATLLGTYLTSGRANQTIVGIYNKKDESAIFIVGAGTEKAARNNAFSIDTSGTIKVKDKTFFSFTNQAIYLEGNNMANLSPTAVFIRDANGHRWRITVSTFGELIINDINTN